MSPDFLYQFEKNAEVGIAAALRSLGASSVYESLGETEFPPVAPRLVVEAVAFVPASGQKGYSRQGLVFDNHYSGQVAVEVNTPRTGGAAYHHAMVGIIRRLFSAASGGLRLAPYDVLEVKESAGTVVFVKEGERDRSRFLFTIQLLIPSGLLDTAEKSAIPTPPTAPV